MSSPPLTTASVRVDGQLRAVATAACFVAPRDAVWAALMFYEEVAESPHWLLRYLLPVPVRTEGCKAAVGGNVRCLYTRGHLMKRITGIELARKYAFEVVEQNLSLSRIMLLGGDYALQDAANGGTRVTLSTRYISPHQPAWLCRHVEAAVCHLFHHHILDGMQRRLASR